MTSEEQPTSTKSFDNVIGALIDNHYEILDVISSGGAGDVFKVRNVEMDTVAAAKVMHADSLANLDHLNRFKREAQILCKLRHPNIVSVHRFGIDQQFGPYLIMDLIEGVPLSRMIKEQGPMPLDKASPLLTQICDGMSAAHSLGIVHRDIKPSNVMVKGTGGNQQAVIIDFGTGKIVDGDAQKLTQTAALMGTPLYMAPEQCLSEKADKRTDVYAMGCLMYEVLTGKPPFTGESSFDVMNKHLKEVPAPPSAANPKARIPKQIDEVIELALRKDPSTRIDTFTKFKEAIDAARQRPTYAKLVMPRLEPKNANSHWKIILLAFSVLAAGVGAWLFTQHEHQVAERNTDLASTDTVVNIAQMQRKRNDLISQNRRMEAIELQKKVVADYKAHNPSSETYVEQLFDLFLEQKDAKQYAAAEETAKELAPLAWTHNNYRAKFYTAYADLVAKEHRFAESVALLEKLSQNMEGIPVNEKFAMWYRLTVYYQQVPDLQKALQAAKKAASAMNDPSATLTAADIGMASVDHARILRHLNRAKEAVPIAVAANKSFESTPQGFNMDAMTELALDYAATKQMKQARETKAKLIEQLARRPDARFERDLLPELNEAIPSE